MPYLTITFPTEQHLRTVQLQLEASHDGVILTAIEPQDGIPAPECAHLVGSFFPEEDAVVSAVISLIERNGVLDTLDRVLLTTDVYKRWHQAAGKLTQAWAARRLATPEIGDEMAQILPQGKLRLFCEIKGQPSLELVLERSEWQWASQSARAH